MKFSIGDKVLLKRTGEEGYVTAFIDKNMVEVDLYGTTFPVHIDDLDHPYLKWFTDKNIKKKKSHPDQIPIERIADRKQRLSQGVYISFMPVYKTHDMEDIVDVIKIYLLNEMPTPIKFYYDMRISQASNFKHEGTLHAFGNMYLHSISYPDMNEQPRFHWQLSDPANNNMAISEGMLRIRPAKLFEHISQLQQKNEPTFSYLLIDEFKIKPKEMPIENTPFVKSYEMPATLSHRNIELPKSEIDLHIETILDNPKGLTNSEKLKIQLDVLQHHVHLAIVHRQERLIVIHGLGTGKLRDEVHSYLKHIPEVSRYKNEWSGKYGFGATEVWFRY